MKNIKKLLILSSFVALSFNFIGCDDSSSSNKEPQNYEQALIDLQKVANSVENLSIGQVDKNDQRNKRELIWEEDTSDEYTEINYMYDDVDGFKYYDTTKYFDINTNDPIKVKDAWSLDSYKSKVAYYMEDATTKGHWTGEITTNLVEISANEYSYDEDAFYSGYIDYFKDDLRLDFSSVTMISRNYDFTYSYNFTFMDGKYSVTMNGTLNIDDLIDDTVVTEILSGPISNNASETVGIFKVYSDDTVKIFDKDGNLIKKAS